jgi:hypothetical protein
VAALLSLVMHGSCLAGTSVEDHPATVLAPLFRLVTDVPLRPAAGRIDDRRVDAQGFVAAWCGP